MASSNTALTSPGDKKSSNPYAHVLQQVKSWEEDDKLTVHTVKHQIENLQKSHPKILEDKIDGEDTLLALGFKLHIPALVGHLLSTSKMSASEIGVKFLISAISFKDLGEEKCTPKIKKCRETVQCLFTKISNEVWKLDDETDFLYALRHSNFWYAIWRLHFLYSNVKVNEAMRRTGVDPEKFNQKTNDLIKALLKENKNEDVLSYIQALNRKVFLPRTTYMSAVKIHVDTFAIMTLWILSDLPFAEKTSYIVKLCEVADPSLKNPINVLFTTWLKNATESDTIRFPISIGMRILLLGCGDNDEYKYFDEAKKVYNAVFRNNFPLTAHDLHYAIENGYKRLVETMANEYGLLNAALTYDNGKLIRTPILEAVVQGQNEIVEYFLEQRATHNIQELMQTALLFESNNYTLIKILMIRGAELTRNSLKDPILANLQDIIDKVRTNHERLKTVLLSVSPDDKTFLYQYFKDNQTIIDRLNEAFSAGAPKPPAVNPAIAAAAAGTGILERKIDASLPAASAPRLESSPAPSAAPLPAFNPMAAAPTASAPPVHDPVEGKENASVAVAIAAPTPSAAPPAPVAANPMAAAVPSAHVAAVEEKKSVAVAIQPDALPSVVPHSVFAPPSAIVAAPIDSNKTSKEINAILALLKTFFDNPDIMNEIAPLPVLSRRLIAVGLTLHPQQSHDEKSPPIAVENIIPELEIVLNLLQQNRLALLNFQAISQLLIHIGKSLIQQPVMQQDPHPTPPPYDPGPA